MGISALKFRILVILSSGLIAISFASIFIKLCQAPPLVICTYRLIIAAIFYLFISIFRSGSRLNKFSPAQIRLAFLSGVFLSLHFITWITSLRYTSVASSVVLVQTAPVFVVLGSYFLLRESPSGKMIYGIIITIMGAIIVSCYDFRSNEASFDGNVLALLGAVSVAGYLIAGRKLRVNLDTVQYVSVVYSVAAVVTIALTVASGNSLFNYDFKTFTLFFAIAMVPQVIGHTSLNWALKHFSAMLVSILTLTEPVGATILAFFILGEKPGLARIVGGVIILAGLLITLLSERKE